MSRDFLSEKWDLPTRDHLQLKKNKTKQTKKKKKKKKRPIFAEHPPGYMGVHKCAWIGVGTVGMCTVCHAMSYSNF